jgi:hypothetical protein
MGLTNLHVKEASMRTLRAMTALLVLLLLAGCSAPDIIPSANPQIEVVGEDQGWVQVRVTDVPMTGYGILWGDADTPYGISDVVPWEEHYEHFYQAVFGEKSGEQVAMEYEIRLIDNEGSIIDHGTVLVGTSNCHLELVSILGRDVRVKYWGRFGIEYSISWGDHFADHAMVSTQSASGYATHTYDAPGRYSVGMEEIWAPRQTFFAIEIE